MMMLLKRKKYPVRDEFRLGNFSLTSAEEILNFVIEDLKSGFGFVEECRSNFNGRCA